MDRMGLLATALVLVVGIVIGMWWRRSQGRLRPHRAPAAVTPDARVTAGVVEDPGDSADRVDPVLLAALGVEPAAATLLQFSSAFCAPCRAVRRLCADVARLLPGVRHVEVDAESHLDAVRALNVWRTPTLLVLDAGGRIAKRATGVPSRPQLIAALDKLLPVQQSAPHRR
jgi:thiol-disulfide isomerase/thioredoxin